MRTPQRRLDPGLIEATQAAPQRYAFFQLVRLYELAFRHRGGDPVSERIRFRSALRLGFAPSQVDGMATRYRLDAGGQPTAEPDRVEITPAFIGMLADALTDPQPGSVRGLATCHATCCLLGRPGAPVLPTACAAD